MGLVGLIISAAAGENGDHRAPSVVWEYPMITAAIVIAIWLAVNSTLLAAALWRAYLKLQQEQRSRWEVSHQYHSAGEQFVVPRGPKETPRPVLALAEVVCANAGSGVQPAPTIVGQKLTAAGSG
jgi:hypothetical protein